MKQIFSNIKAGYPSGISDHLLIYLPTGESTSVWSLFCEQKIRCRFSSEHHIRL